MKTVLKIIGFFVLLILLLALILPFVFKGTITDLAREEANKNLNAKVNFQDINLSIFKSFPNFYLGIEDLTIIGLDDFEGDTLAYIPELGVAIDLFSVIKGSTYTINKINIQSPAILVKTLENGKANYDIAPESDPAMETPEPEEANEEGFMLKLKRVIISDAIFVYDDQAGNINLSLNGLNFSLSGDLSADQTTLKTNTSINSFNLSYEGIPYFSNTQVKYKADILADLKNEIYTLKKNSLSLNELLLSFDGSVSMIKESINVVMTFNTPKTEFKHILSLVPVLYKKDFASLKSSGKLGIDGHIKGMYSESSLPAFSLNLEVVDGFFQYPDLPASVMDVNIRTNISNKGGDADNTVIDVSRLHMELGQNPVDLSLLIKTPLSDPDIKGKLKGKIDLSTFKDIYPLETGEEIAGKVVADITLNGKLSAIENERYDSFTALGSILLQNFSYINSYTEKPVGIGNAQLNFSPQYLDLVDLKCTIGENDIRATGKIENYLAYALGDKILTGTFNTQSKYLNLNELMVEEETDSPAAEDDQDTTAMTILEVPGRIDFTMNSSFNMLIYDNLEMSNVNGKISIKDKKLTLNNLSMNILEGEMVVSGSYTTPDSELAYFDFDLDMHDLNIQQAYNTFGVFQQYAPIAKKVDGKFSTDLNLKSTLDQNMSPIYESMVGGGQLQTTALGITNVNSLNKIADAIKFDDLRDLSIEKILLMFEFVDGKILIEPFDIKGEQFTGQMAGWTALDQTIDYTMNMNVPRAAFGQEANAVLENLVSQANSKGAGISLGENVSIDVLIGGLLSDPTIKTNLKETGKNVVEDVKKKVDEEIQKKKEELTQEAKEEAQKILDEADKQGKKLIAEAEKQAAAVRKSAADGAKTIRDEADKQAKAVEAEGKKNGFLAEAAAKETAKQMRKEADKQAKSLESEADKQAKNIVDTAKTKANKLNLKAREEANKLLEQKK